MASGEVGKKEKVNPSVKPTVCHIPFQGRLENGKWGGWKKEEDITPHLSFCDNFSIGEKAKISDIILN